MHWDGGVKQHLRDVMPGIRICRWKSKYVDPLSTIIDNAAEKIVEALGGLPADQQRIALRELKKMAGLEDLKPSTWVEARNEALAAAGAWRLKDSSIERSTREGLTERATS